MDGVPRTYTSRTQDVNVKNWPLHLSLATDYFRALKRRYKEFQDAAKENQKGQTAVMRYYTPKGQEIRIANVSRYQGEETILLQGDIEEDDGTRNPCDVVVQPQSAAIVLKLLVLDAPEPEVRFDLYSRP